MANVRAYEPSDLRPLLALWRRSSDLAHPFLPSSFQDNEAKNVENLYLPNAETWVAVDGTSGVVGFIAMLPDNEIGGLFCDPDVIGKGFGRALVDHVKSTRRRLTVEVFEDNTIGRGFYEKCGFTPHDSARGVHEASGFPTLRLVLDNPS